MYGRDGHQSTLSVSYQPCITLHVMTGFCTKDLLSLLVGAEDPQTSRAVTCRDPNSTTQPPPEPPPPYQPPPEHPSRSFSWSGKNQLLKGFTFSRSFLQDCHTFQQAKSVRSICPTLDTYSLVPLAPHTPVQLRPSSCALRQLR